MMSKVIIFFSLTFVIIITVMTLLLGSFRTQGGSVTSENDVKAEIPQESIVFRDSSGHTADRKTIQVIKRDTIFIKEDNSAERQKLDSLAGALEIMLKKNNDLAQKYKSLQEKLRQQSVKEQKQEPIAAKPDQRNTNIKQVAKIYEKMGAQEAAKILSGLDTNEVAAIIGFMRKRQAAKILAVMKPRTAQIISKKLASAN